MKKTLLLIVLGVLTFNNVKAQEPTKRETFNFIIDNIESACEFSIYSSGKFEVTSRNANDLKFTIVGRSTHKGVTVKRYRYIELKYLKRIRWAEGDISVKIYFKKKYKEQMLLSNGSKSRLDYIKDYLPPIGMCTKSDAKRLAKALNHLIKLQKGGNSFFDD